MTSSSVVRFVALAALWFYAPAQAQWLSTAGVKAGINSSNSAIEQTSIGYQFETQRRIGWQAAIFAEWLKLPVVSVVTQVEYARRGFAEEQVRTGIESPEPLGTFQLQTRLDYVSIPVLLKLQPSNSGVKPYALLGPRFDFLVNHETALYEDGKLDLEFSLAEAFNDRAVGATVGLGVVAKALSLPLLLEARYNFDFDDVADAELLTVKNNSVDLWLGIMF